MRSTIKLTVGYQNRLCAGVLCGDGDTAATRDIHHSGNINIEEILCGSRGDGSGGSVQRLTIDGDRCRDGLHGPPVGIAIFAPKDTLNFARHWFVSPRRVTSPAPSRCTMQGLPVLASSVKGTFCPAATVTIALFVNSAIKSILSHKRIRRSHCPAALL